jgi:hypothetical protein
MHTWKEKIVAIELRGGGLACGGKHLHVVVTQPGYVVGHSR